MPPEGRWQDDTFSANDVGLANCEINTRTGTFRVIPVSHAFHKPDELAWQTEQDLRRFFAAHGVEMRGIMVTHTKRPHPLDELVELTGDLATIDRLETLKELLTDAHIKELLSSGNTNGNNAQVKARYREVIHNGIVVNHGLTFHLVKGSKRLREAPRTYYYAPPGTPEKPVKLKNGSYFCVLREPFGYVDTQTGKMVSAKQVIVRDSQIAAARLGATLMKLECPTYIW